MSPADCKNELVATSRRGRLTTAERSALAAHLASCESCRAGLALGRAFDAGGTLEPEDGLRIAKLGMVARRWAESDRATLVASGARPRRAARTWLFAACLCLIALGASAGARLWVQGPPQRTEAAAPAPRAAAVRPPARPRERVAQAVEAAVPASAAPIAASAAPIAASAEASAALTSRPVNPARAEVESAKTLFQRASNARRSGEAKLATSLYAKLQREYPGSAEAKLSHLRLGSLLLEHGDAGMALAQFDRHLAAGGSALAPEALYGRGRALAVMGRSAEERRTWEQLIARYPASPYASHARRRLKGATGAIAGKDTP